MKSPDYVTLLLVYPDLRVKPGCRLRGKILKFTERPLGFLGTAIPVYSHSIPDKEIIQYRSVVF